MVLAISSQENIAMASIVLNN